MNQKVDLKIAPAILYKLTHLVIALNILDVLTTAIGLSIGLVESNPYASLTLAFLSFKFGCFLAFYPIIYVAFKKLQTVWLFIPLTCLMICVGAFSFIVTQNIAMILWRVTS